MTDKQPIAANAGSEPVATVFTMEALTPGGGVKYHATIHKALPAGTKLYTHPSPPEGMVGGWMPIETAPVATVFTMEALTPGGGVKYHATIHKALPAGTKLYTHPSPPEGMVGGWMPIETAPVAGLILLVVEDSAGERRVFPAEASHENGVWVWQVTLGWLGWTRLHSGWTPILWRRIPPPPTSSADSSKEQP